MDNLRSLLLPSSDMRIVHHHCAVVLRYLEFSNTRLSGQAEDEFLMWLDGQTNIVSLHFLFLSDSDDNDVPKEWLKIGNKLYIPMVQDMSVIVEHGGSPTRSQTVEEQEHIGVPPTGHAYYSAFSALRVPQQLMDHRKDVEESGKKN
ncbi:hypothetical protein F5146DRAFT_1139767 [Armillaria mellea]|nr:hypothetical protein F5146DRAFT_1139767 [Armillaria mellea]